MRIAAVSGLAGPARAMVALCRREGASGLRGELPALLGTPDFAEALSDLAQRHAVLGLILTACERAGVLENLPEPVAQKFSRSLPLLRRQAAFWDLERDFVLRQLTERNLHPVLLKGAALRLTAYADPVERSLGDIDVLVPEAAVDEAVAALISRGYQPQIEAHSELYRKHHHHLILRKERGFIVEVHWALEPARSPFPIDADAFRRDARAVTTSSGLLARVPCAEHMVVHLSIQSLEDGFSRLGRLVDIDRVISTTQHFDWVRLMAAAAQCSATAVVALSLRLCQILLRTELSRSWIARLELPRMTNLNLALLDPVALVVNQLARRHPALERLLLLWCLPGVADRIRLLRAIRAGQDNWYTNALPRAVNASRDSPRSVALLKLAAFQLWVYFSALGGSLTGSHRALRLRAWHGT
jgi:Uncharacterised nucleotidyltransferase